MTKYIAIAVLSLALLIPATSNASRYTFDDSRSGAVIPGKAYLGLKYGVFKTEQTVGSYDVEMDNLGFVFGGEINEMLALEFDYSQTVSADKEESGGSTAKQSVDTLGFFLVAKTSGDVYARGRVGYTRIEHDISFMGDSGSDNIYGIAYGIGAGMKVGKGAAIEIEYTVYPETDEFFGVQVAGDIENEFLSLGFVWYFE
jgi:opacity protein-like surface antigen